MAPQPPLQPPSPPPEAVYQPFIPAQGYEEQPEQWQEQATQYVPVPPQPVYPAPQPISQAPQPMYQAPQPIHQAPPPAPSAAPPPASQVYKPQTVISYNPAQQPPPQMAAPAQKAVPAKKKTSKLTLILAIAAVVFALVAIALYLIYGTGNNNGTDKGSTGIFSGNNEGDQARDGDGLSALSRKLIGSWSLKSCAFSYEDTGVGGFDGSFSIDEEGLHKSSNILIFNASGDFDSGYKLVDPNIFAGESLDLTQYNRWDFIEDDTPARGSVLSGRLELKPGVEGFGYSVMLSDDNILTLIITELFIAESMTTPQGYITKGGEVPMTYTLTLVPTPGSSSGQASEQSPEQPPGQSPGQAPPPAQAQKISVIACDLTAVSVGSRTFNPIDSNVLFILNGVLQGTGQIVVATDANLFISFAFKSDEDFSPDIKLILTDTGGNAIEWSQTLNIDSGEQSLEAYINAGGPADASYSVELYVDGALAFSEMKDIS